MIAVCDYFNKTEQHPKEICHETFLRMRDLALQR